MEKVNEKKPFLGDALRGIFYCVILNLIFIFVLSIINKFVPIDSKVIVIINQVIKIAAIFGACFIGIKEHKSALFKGMLIGLVGTIICWIISSIIQKSFTFTYITAIEFVTGLVVGALCGVLNMLLRKNKNR